MPRISQFIEIEIEVTRSRVREKLLVNEYRVYVEADEKVGI